jgi:hypothetical protein
LTISFIENVTEERDLMDIRVEWNERDSTSVLNEENNTSGSGKCISDLGTEIRRSVLNGTFRPRLDLEITAQNAN